jgi:Ser/Thr protein kinase RdoA (MazF antagonist)
VPVAAPVLTDDGKACATDDEGALHAVFPMLPSDDADSDPGLDPVLFQNVGAAIARLHIALASCPFGVESWRVGPDLLPALWQTAQERLPADALAGLSACIRPRWELIV